jgi:hypothetical protein
MTPGTSVAAKASPALLICVQASASNATDQASRGSRVAVQRKSASAAHV